MFVRHIVILGGGISGLSLAWFLKQRYGTQIRITILEKNKRVGGWIQTIEKEDFLFELGPHSLRSQGASATLRLIQDLGIADQILIPDSSAQFRYLWLDQKLTVLPHNVVSLLFSSWVKDCAAALWRDFRSPASHEDDESVYSFSMRRLGLALTHKWIDPMVTGIYAGSMHHLSIRSCFPKWYEWEKKYGSLLRGMLSKKPQSTTTDIEQLVKGASSFTFKEGMETLVKALENKLRAEILTDCRATEIHFQPNCVEVDTSDGKRLQADYLFSTIPAHPLADLMARHSTEVGSLLTSIDSVTVVGVNLGYRDSVLTKKGFGYLVPQCSGEQVLGAIWDSSLFPEQSRRKRQTRITVLLGGAHHPEVSHLSDDTLLSISIQAMQKHLGILKKPDVFHIYRAKQSIPQYYVGHHRRLQHINDVMARDFPRVICLGSAFNGVSINDCIAQAEKYAEQKSLLEKA